MLRLLAGLYQPTAGAVEIDGLDLRQLDPADFRRHIGVVEQEPRLFRGTVRENLLLGREAAVTFQPRAFRALAPRPPAGEDSL